METNRTALLEAALSSFSQKGYNAVGVQQIADQVGVGKPTLYHYFKNKAGLLSALFDTYLIADLPQLVRATERKDDIPLTLNTMAISFCELAMKNPKFYCLMIHLFYSGRGDEAYLVAKPYLDRLEALIFGIFESAAWQLGNMHGRQRQFARSYLGMLFEFVFSNLQEGKTLEQKDSNLLVHQFMHGIYS
ncbi:transcriptional regulator [Sphaerochaeta pleomorpha str. Grapes]|uniref:Transcriptional regulator n=1 Tax=Sphaerochaeta pleomorpha (strain ATCC BAA-1885 / DSM 22778 / Grapes) TaxID=158190 RepID=G8QS20_SPHPG|nr:TetR/AcrR family transcriptional regulator [Sphaerochaeta pleomorpha]AEV30018.1 transcriptional regulator [Sphaerochaeta pleomorpha str. Grapes]